MHLVFTHSRQVREPHTASYNTPSPAMIRVGVVWGRETGIQEIYSEPLIINVDHMSHFTDLLKNQCRFNLIVFVHKFDYMAESVF